MNARPILKLEDTAPRRLKTWFESGRRPFSLRRVSLHQGTHHVMMFLTAEQLEDLTGRKQPAAQIRWLRRNGVHHFVRADGHPRVLSDALRRRDTEEVRPGPDFAALTVAR